MTNCEPVAPVLLQLDLTGNQRSCEDQCSTDSWRRSRFVNTFHLNLVALAIMADEFPSGIPFCSADDWKQSCLAEGELARVPNSGTAKIAKRTMRAGNGMLLRGNFLLRALS